jgi:hexokinase
MRHFMLMEEVVHIPTKKKATVVATKLDKEGRQLIEVKYEGGSRGWTTADALTTFIQDGVEYDGEFLSE